MVRLAILIAFPIITASAPNVDFVVVQATANANVAPDIAWSKIGDYCVGLTRLFDMPCHYTKGKGGLGTVRSLRDGAVLEAMIAQTPYSYTYAQITGSNLGLDFHGTLSVEPTAGGGSKISYTAVYDQARIAEPNARTQRRQSLQSGFDRVVLKAKQIAEGNAVSNR